ncbi:MAG TPA: hypothetical protein VNA69_09530 [Thermoanaerobaculia bacterium]|nr:hypothetical protein [Thermoanaerobaculia bacterium]
MSVLLSLCLTTIVAFGQGPKVGDRLPVTIEVAESPAQQLLHCEKLIQRLAAVPENRRVVAGLEILANLDVVQKVWPTNAEAVLQSYLLKDEVSRQCGMTGNAREALLKAVPLSKRTSYEPIVDMRLGQVYDRLGDRAAAEQHFKSAEQSVHRVDVSPQTAASVLSASAFFYHNQDRPRDAMRAYRAAANWKKQSDVLAANYLLASLKEAVTIKESDARAEAKRDVDAIGAAITAGRKTAKRAEDQAALTRIELEANRIRTRHNVH